MTEGTEKTDNKIKTFTPNKHWSVGDRFATRMSSGHAAAMEEKAKSGPIPWRLNDSKIGEIKFIEKRILDDKGLYADVVFEVVKLPDPEST